MRTGIEFFDLYQEMLTHQREHDDLDRRCFPGKELQPSWSCARCAVERREQDGWDLRKRYSWAVPDEAALKTIAEHSPGGVMEIGAGGGYWAMLLQQRGVDVIAYDPAPPGLSESQWHSGRAWTAVRVGDHLKAADHPTRALLLCWPSYDEPWAALAIRAYRGDTVIYIGEGPGGCTGDDAMHALLGERSGCWHHDDDFNDLPCPGDCPGAVGALFEPVAEARIPQWHGLHDTLGVYRRVKEAA